MRRIIMNKNFLYRDLSNYTSSLFSYGRINIEQKLEMIESNLKHTLRPYQYEALLNLLLLLNIDPNDENQEILHKYINNNHLLYRMATGSGKTDILAAAILALYSEKNIQRFLFTTNLKSVLNKTKQNLTHNENSKYLYNNHILINGDTIIIQEIDENQDFPPVEKNTIYIKIVSIQKLLPLLNRNLMRENRTTIDNLIENNLGIIVDEAHHFNKNATTTIKYDNKDNAVSFEDTIDFIRNNVKENDKLCYQLEFTATLPFETNRSGATGKKAKQLQNKYLDKLIYDYSLTQFVDVDGYGKKLNQIANTESDNREYDNRIKMILGMMMSEYRRAIAIKFGFVDFKPIILFKSNTISGSNNFEKEFINLLEYLTPDDIRNVLTILSTSNSSTIQGMIDYYNKNNLVNIVRVFQESFIGKIINANDKNEELTIKNLNSLDQPDNPFRIVFAVQKVSEGWDVLNLYDIVRLDENGNRNQTTGEAQLVGRGARYYPLKHNSGKVLTQQTFTEENILDESLKNQILLTDNNYEDQIKELSLLESLHYHTIQNEEYLSNLQKAYSTLGIPVYDENQPKEFNVSMKENFKKSFLYQSGYFVENRKTHPKPQHYSRLSDYGVGFNFTETVSSNLHETTVFKDGKIHRRKYVDSIISIKDRYIWEAMEKIEFYRFNKMKKKMPNLNSKREFVEGDNWLGQWDKKITFKYPEDEELTEQMILTGVIRVLRHFAQKIQDNYMKPVGTKEFVKVPAKEVLPENYSREFKQRIGMNYSEISTLNDTWSPYNIVIGGALELRLVNYLKDNKILNELKEKYDTVYLIRNDEAKIRLKLHEFGGVRTYMPDYLLYLASDLDSKNYQVIQIYLEPKGENLYSSDKWKENLLLALGEDAEIEFEETINDFRLLGVKFFIGDSTGSPIPEYLEAFDRDFRKKTALPIGTPSNKNQTTLFSEENNMSLKELTNIIRILKKVETSYEKAKNSFENEFNYYGIDKKYYSEL